MCFKKKGKQLDNYHKNIACYCN